MYTTDSKLPKARPHIMQQQKNEGKLNFLDGRRSIVIIFKDSSINPLNINAVTITEINVPLVKIGRLKITYSVNATGKTATRPSNEAQNSYRIFIPGIANVKTMKTITNNAKHNAIGAKILIN